ncbi:hypothetical protein RB195_024215 [Necator americanus]|uniref:Uncharacterized protein n=1 Tax=Necator americanus TaxID=51031 RepID=A0ABR1EM92_NECAM
MIGCRGGCGQTFSSFLGAFGLSASLLTLSIFKETLTSFLNSFSLAPPVLMQRSGVLPANHAFQLCDDFFVVQHHWRVYVGGHVRVIGFTFLPLDEDNSPNLYVVTQVQRDAKEQPTTGRRRLKRV